MITTQTLRRAGIGFLLFTGLVPALGRVVNSTLNIADPVRFPAPALTDSLSVVLMRRMIGMPDDDPAAPAKTAELIGFLGKFTEHPWMTLMHVLPAIVLFGLVPLQFSSKIRNRRPALHRWSGRAILLTSPLMLASALYYGVAMPYAGAVESAAVILFSGLYLLFGALGFVAIRRGETATHRRWMTRMLAVALGISVQRMLATIAALAWHLESREWFGVSLWIGFGISVAAGEWWVRRRAADQNKAGLAAA